MLASPGRLGGLPSRPLKTGRVPKCGPVGVLRPSWASRSSKPPKNAVSVSRPASEAVERLRTWATGRCLAANTPGIYGGTASSSKGGRSVRRDPSNN